MVKRLENLNGVVKYSQHNTIVPTSKSTTSGVWSVIGDDENSFFAPLYPIHSPSKCLGRCLLKIHNLPPTGVQLSSSQNALLCKVSLFQNNFDKNWRLFANAFHAWCFPGWRCATKLSKRRFYMQVPLTS